MRTTFATLIFALSFGILPAHAATLEEQEQIIAVQQARLTKLEKDLSDLRTLVQQNKTDAANTYATKVDVANSFVTKTDADNKYATDATISDRLKTCSIRMGYSKGNATNPTTTGASNPSENFLWTAMALPNGIGAGDKLYYDLNCFRIWLPPIVINPGDLVLKKQ